MLHSGRVGLANEGVSRLRNGTEVARRRYAFIPVVQPAGGAAPPRPSGVDPVARLIEVYAQLQTGGEEDRAVVKGFDPVAVPLRKVGLYAAGCNAVSAVRKLGLRTPWAALYQRCRRQTWLARQQLHVADAIGSTEGRSAELGLALALLMNASGTPQQSVFATGALSTQDPPSDNSSRTPWRPDDVEVLPVSCLPEKLQLVIQQIGQRGLPAAGSRSESLFFTPTHFERKGVLTAVAELPEVQALDKLGVKVVPVAWLSEAARELKAHKTRYLLADRLLQGLLSGLTTLGVLWAGWTAWCSAPISLTYLSAGPSAPAAEPFVACFTAAGYYPLSLRQAGVGHKLPVNENLGWKIRVGEAEGWRARVDSWLGNPGYYVAQVMVSEFSPAKVMIPQRSSEEGPLRIIPGGIWEWGWELNDRAESNGLVLLAQRQAPFDADALRRRLLERFPEAAGSQGVRLDVMAAVNFIMTQAPGAVSFIFQTLESKSDCLQDPQ